MIHTNPSDTLVDEDVTIVVGGLKSGQKVTLRSSCYNDSKELFESFAFYKTNEDGIVNVLRDRAMYGGSYEGVEPMGLFWSMQASKLNKRKFARWIARDVNKPAVVCVEAFDDWKDLEELRKEEPITNTKVNRWYKKKGVTRVPIKVGKIRGTLFVPHENGPFPAVIDMFGGAGGLFEFRASMLASRGFLTLALAIFGYDDLPPPFHTPTNLDYYEDAVQFLQNHPQSMKGGVGVVGTSYGAEIALSVATYVPGVTCAICINGGNNVNYVSCHFRGFQIPPSFGEFSNMIIRDNTTYVRNCFIFPDKSEDIKKHYPEFHKSNTSILFVGSELDGCYDMQKVHKLAKDRIKKFGSGTGKHQFVLYHGAGHLLELPNTPLSRIVYWSASGLYQHYDGRIQDHAKAEEHSWQKIMNFLNQNIISETKSKL